MCYWLQHIAKENPTSRKVSGTLEKERDVPLVATHREGESDAPQSEQHARKGGMCHWLQHTAKENPTRRKVSSTPEREGCATGCSTPRRRIRRAATCQEASRQASTARLNQSAVAGQPSEAP